jgi:hypothetical protein
MKKQLFSLVMLLALVVLAGTSAMAQDGLSIETAIWHLAGSSHNLEVNEHTDFTYLWTIEAITCDGTTASATTTAHVAPNNAFQTVLSYDTDASGIYRITLVETDGDNGCNTRREFFTAVMSVDVTVIASDATINAAADLTTCNDYELIRGSNLVGNTDADDGGADALGTWTNAALFNQRWVNIVLSTSNTAACPAILNAPLASDFNWNFTYDVTSTGGSTTFADEFLGFQPAIINTTTVPAATVTYSDNTDLSNTVQVQAGITNITIPLRTNIRWATTDVDQDQNFTYTVSAVELDDADTDSNFDDGTETTLTNNASLEQVIHASPATPRISVTN